MDGWNARFTAAKKNDSVAAAASVPTERYEPGKTAWKIVDLNSAHHYEEHAERIRARRAAKGI